MQATAIGQWEKKLSQIIQWALFIVALAMPFSIAVTQLAIAVAMVAWMVCLVVLKGCNIRRLGIEGALIAFIGSEILATIFAMDRLQSLLHLKRLLLMPLIYVIASQVSDEKTLKRMWGLFFFSLLWYAFSGIGWYVMHPGRRIQHIHHFVTAGGITMIGAVMGVAFASLAKTQRARHGYLLASAIIIYSLILTSTRGSWVGFFCGLMVVLFFSRKLLIACVPILAILFYLLTPPAFSHRLHHFFDPDWRTNAKRLYIWKIGWDIFKDHPLVGIGDINPTAIYHRYAEKEPSGRLNHFHSNFVHIAVTLGSIGLAAFLFLVGVLFRKLYLVFQQRRRALAFTTTLSLASLAVFTAFMCNGFFEWNFGDAEVITMIWFCMGMSLAEPGITPQC